MEFNNDAKRLVVPDNIKEMAAHYGRSTRTMKRWLKRLGFGEPAMGGRIFTPVERWTIQEKLGTNE